MIREITLIGKTDSKEVKAGLKIDINDGMTRAQILHQMWDALGDLGIRDRVEIEHEQLLDRVR